MKPAPIRLDAPPANDNAAVGHEKAVVSIPRGRAENTYACSGNLILPLRFARRFPGWEIRPLSTSSPTSQR